MAQRVWRQARARALLLLATAAAAALALWTGAAAAASACAAAAAQRACASSADCSVGYCSAAGVCSAALFAPIGSACNASVGVFCQVGLVCQDSEANIGQGTCQYVTMRTPCRASTPSCLCLDGFCNTMRAVGDFCRTSSECVSGTCQYGTCVASPAGTPCTGSAVALSNSCPRGQFCNASSVCQPSAQVGQPCYSSAPDACAPGTLCSLENSGGASGVCRPMFSVENGGACYPYEGLLTGGSLCMLGYTCQGTVGNYRCAAAPNTLPTKGCSSCLHNQACGCNAATAAPQCQSVAAASALCQPFAESLVACLRTRNCPSSASFFGNNYGYTMPGTCLNACFNASMTYMCCYQNMFNSTSEFSTPTVPCPMCRFECFRNGLCQWTTNAMSDPSSLTCLCNSDYSGRLCDDYIPVLGVVYALFLGFVVIGVTIMIVKLCKTK